MNWLKQVWNVMRIKVGIPRKVKAIFRKQEERLKLRGKALADYLNSLSWETPNQYTWVIFYDLLLEIWFQFLYPLQQQQEELDHI